MNQIRNGEALVWPILAHKTTEKLLYERGVSLEFAGALRDFRAKKWKATHIQGHTNLIMVTCPMLPRGATNSSDVSQRNHDLPESVVMGRNKALQVYESLPKDDKVRKILVIFPLGMRLCNKCFHGVNFKGVAGVDIDYEISSPRSLTGWNQKVQAANSMVEQLVPVYNYESTIVWHFKVAFYTKVDPFF